MPAHTHDHIHLYLCACLIHGYIFFNKNMLAFWFILKFFVFFFTKSNVDVRVPLCLFICVSNEYSPVHNERTFRHYFIDIIFGLEFKLHNVTQK